MYPGVKMTTLDICQVRVGSSKDFARQTSTMAPQSRFGQPTKPSTPKTPVITGAADSMTPGMTGRISKKRCASRLTTRAMRV